MVSAAGSVSGAALNPAVALSLGSTSGKDSAGIRFGILGTMMWLGG